MSKPIPWALGHMAAILVACGGPEALDKWNASLPARYRAERAPDTSVDTVAISAAEEKRVRKAAKRLNESNRV